ncbi:hypothetical protein EDB81DRAFT_890856 [Dactylonectria macrodidyma]|uniref:Uncharacterized protein n=1 Tax=Dactylonectria macrodidyma TaxID=307937 RepID=A0A9P9DM07_9HYPO|nr:hypothetical protein EDB81DRAFT_890856 [Dactylonectria macrodidyma]
MSFITCQHFERNRPPRSPSFCASEGPWESDYKIFKQPSSLKAVSAVLTMVSAYAATTVFFAIAAEMKEPEYYTRLLLICHSIITVTHLRIGMVPAKFIFVRLLRGTTTRSAVRSIKASKPTISSKLMPGGELTRHVHMQDACIKLTTSLQVEENP